MWGILLKEEVCKQLSVESLVLGTAQFSGSYGATVRRSMNVNACELLFRQAISAGVRLIDTAPSYGGSEQLIGELLKSVESRSEIKLITKTATCPKLNKVINWSKAERCFTQTFEKSLQHLNVSSVHCLMVHRPEHLLRQGWELARVLKSWKSSGLIEKIGVSFDNECHVQDILRLGLVDLVQLPVNLVDRRWKKFESLFESRHDQGSVCFQARSVFLQGMLLGKNGNLWCQKTGYDMEDLNSWIETQIEKGLAKSRPDLCLRWVAQKRWLDQIVIGFQSADEFADIIKLFPLKTTRVDENTNLQGYESDHETRCFVPSSWHRGD